MRKHKKMKYGFKLTIGMTIYALVFCLLLYVGLSWFWKYIAAYERTRPQKTIDAYMEVLTTEYIQEVSWELIEGVDHNIQSEQQCKDAISEALKHGISYAKKLSGNSDTQAVYMLMSGGKQIGQFTMTAKYVDTYGFTTWVVTDEAFDMSFLIGEGKTVTVPHNYSVYANGVLLSQDYITQSNIPYAALDDYYGTYSLPYMVTYEVAPILGELSLTIQNSNGETVTEEQASDEALVLNSCTEEQIAAVDNLVTNFIDRYVAYATNAGNDRPGNYEKLKSYIVPGSVLAKHIVNAMDGLMWISDRSATILSLEIESRIPFLDNRILCDVTYVVKSIEEGQFVEKTYHSQFVLNQTQSGLLVESMFSA